MRTFFQKHPKLKIILLVAMVVGVLLLLTYKEWDARIGALYALWSVRDSTVIDLTLQEKTFSEPAVPFGRDFLYKGVIISTPWIDVLKTRGEEVLAVNFGEENDRSFLLVDDVGEYSYFLEEIPKAAAIWGTHVDSNYTFHHAMLETTRDDINLFAPRTELVPASVLLMLKSAYVPSGATDIHAFQNSYGVRGFEYVSADSAQVKFYTPDDKPYLLTVQGATPGEMDFMIQSLRTY